MIKQLKIEDTIYGYYGSEKLSNNQTISIFFLHEYKLGKIDYAVVLAISNKKKHINEWLTGKRDVLSDQETGKCGIEGLLWAKRKLIEFEEHISWRSEQITINIDWTDNRRKRVYERGLLTLGYTSGFRLGRKCLFKKLKKTP